MSSGHTVAPFTRVTPVGKQKTMKSSSHSRGAKQAYRETITKRMVGDAAAAASQSIMQKWIQEEVGTDVASGGAPRDDSFTRVTVSTLKADVLKLFTADEGANISRELAHMYHYYLHGVGGNTASGVVPLC